MPVGYYVRENKLTTPPSYYCQTAAEETLGYDEIVEFIHLLEPSITAALANFQPVIKGRNAVRLMAVRQRLRRGHSSHGAGRESSVSSCRFSVMPCRRTRAQLRVVT